MSVNILMYAPISVSKRMRILKPVSDKFYVLIKIPVVSDSILNPK